MQNPQTRPCRLADYPATSLQCISFIPSLFGRSTCGMMHARRRINSENKMSIICTEYYNNSLLRG